MRVFKVTEPVFKTEPLFILGCSFEDFSRFMRRRYRYAVGAHAQDSIGTVLTRARSPHRVVWTDTLAAPVVVHEVFHLVTRICYDKGVTIVAHHPDGACGDETAAYLLEFFAKAVLRRCR